jgi:hypothetical protein
MTLMPRLRLLLPAAALLVGLAAASSPAVASTPAIQPPPSKAVVVLIGANDYGLVSGWPKP